MVNIKVQKKTKRATPSQGKYSVTHYSEEVKPFIDKILKAYPTLGELIASVIEERELPLGYLGKVLGSKSHASDILCGKRPPSLTEMITINTYLGIPFDIQMALRVETPSSDEHSNYEKHLAGLIKNNGYNYKTKKDKAAYLNRLKEHMVSANQSKSTFLRQSLRKNSKANQCALDLLLADAHIKAIEQVCGASHNPSMMNELMEKLVHKLSPTTLGIRKVKKLLSDYGIKFIMMKHLAGTFLDGAVFIDKENSPVVVMTARYDRVDNFWFTLLHELAHIALGHLSKNNPIIFDDLDIFPKDDTEIEADRLARNTLIREDSWVKLDKTSCSASDILDFAIANKISPAIVAGRIRFETKNYRAFASLIGNRDVRKHFPEVFEI